MLLHEIPVERKRKQPRVGRSGKRGTTSGRGTKGQGAHAGRRIRPALRDLIQRLPKLRGRGKNQNKPTSIKRAIINVGDLERMISIPEGIKILGGGEVTKAFTIHKSITLSKIARAKIEKAGGTIS